MTRFVADINEENKHINVPADRMELKDDAILAYNGDRLVAYVDVGVTLSAHLSSKPDKEGFDR